MVHPKIYATHGRKQVTTWRFDYESNHHAPLGTERRKGCFAPTGATRKQGILPLALQRKRLNLSLSAHCLQSVTRIGSKGGNK